MSGPLLGHTWRSNRLRLLAVCVALFAWGSLLPIVYAEFGATFRDILAQGIIPEAFANFGGGDIFSLAGSIALGFIHPIALILVSVFAVGFTTSAVAGERQRGTLEILLSRPVSRRRVYLTLLVAALVFIALAITAFLAGALTSSAIFDVVSELDLSQLPLVWLNGFLMFSSFAAIGLAASISFDRLAPAIGVTIAVLLVSYFLEIIGSLWPDAEFLQPYSLFHYLQTRSILIGEADPFAFALLAAVAVVAIVWALIVFPRRDLAAPA
jgi:beta-exotoxin I transport system permease protein